MKIEFYFTSGQTKYVFSQVAM